MKKLNRKGFTLVELLAVVIVLGLILVILIPNALDAAEKSRTRLFKIEAQNVLKAAREYYENGILDGKLATELAKCQSLSAIGKANSEYKGSVDIVKDGTSVTYTLYLASQELMYNGKTESYVNAGTAPDSVTTDAVAKIETCGK